MIQGAIGGLLWTGVVSRVWWLRGCSVAERAVPSIGTQGARATRHVLVVPETFLTKICIVSASEACELMLETLFERGMSVVVVVCEGGVGVARGR